MRTTKLLLLFLSIISLHACDDDETTMARPYHLVRSLAVLDLTETYTYDAEDRLIRVDSPFGRYSTLLYGDTQVTITTYEPANPSEWTAVVALNEFGYFTSFSGATCVYSSDGNLISLRYEEEDPIVIYNYEYTDGNLTWSGYSGQPNAYYTYTYISDRQETRRSGIQTLMGRPSLNLLSTKTHHSTEGDSSTETFNYTYDDCDRIITETITDEDGTTLAVKTFTYFD